MQIAAGITGGRAEPQAEALRPEIAGFGYSVETVSTLESLDALRPEWLALEAVSPAAAVFQSFPIVRLWAKHFLGQKRGANLNVAVVREAGRAVLIFPTAISGPSALRVARIAGDPIAQYSELLLDPSRATPAAFAAALASLKIAGADAVVLRRLREDSALYRLASARLRPAMAQTVAPCADLSAFAGFEAFRGNLSKKVRHGLRNRRNHLERAGEHRFDILRGGAEARAAIAEAIDLKRKWLVQRGNLSSAFVDPATKACLLDLAESETSGAVVARLVINGEAAAIRFGIEHCGAHFTYMSAYDARFSDVSPGKLLMEHTIASLFERGMRTLDMLPPEGQHKRDWCNAEVGVADYTLPLTRSGRAYAEIYQELLRPGLKRAFELMPAPLRSLAAALFVGI
jgi:CelD/BcsL family acetyltransferase involved in cellulose biosynthesis